MTLSGNQVLGGEGAIPEAGGRAGNGGAARGAGWMSQGGSALAVNVTLSGNRASGGDGGDASDYQGPTYYPGTPGQPGLGQGGGLLVEGGDVALEHCTIIDNSVRSGFAGFLSDAGDRSGYDPASDVPGTGAALEALSGSVSLRASVLHGKDSSFIHASGGVLRSRGWNWIGEAASGASGVWQSTDRRGADPRLSALLDLGGIVPVHAPRPGSPLIDGVGQAEGEGEASAWDARGFPRVSGVAADIGACEIQGPAVGNGPDLTLHLAGGPVLVDTEWTLGADVAGEPPISFQWLRNGKPIAGAMATNSELTLPRVADADAGSYQLRAANAQGTTTSGEVLLEVRPSFVVPDFRLVASFPGPGDTFMGGLALGASDHLLTAGTTSQNVRFGASVITSGVWVASVGKQGGVDWVRGGATRGFKTVAGVAADAEGATYVAGDFDQRLTFSETFVEPVGGADVFLGRFRPGGALQWLIRAGGSSHETATGLAVNAAGDALLVGYFMTNTTFGSQEMRSRGFTDGFVALVDRAGRIRWARQVGGAQSDYVLAVAFGKSGRCYLAGTFEREITFDSNTALTAEARGSFLACYDGAGKFQWAERPFAHEADARLTTLAVDASENLFAAGSANEVAVGDWSAGGKGHHVGLLAKYDAIGRFLWGREEGGEAKTAFAGWSKLAVDADGNCIAAGGLAYSSGFASGSPAASGWDFAVAKISTDGLLRWLEIDGGPYYDYCNGLAVDAGGEVFLGLGFQRHTSVGGQVLHARSDGYECLIARVAAQSRLDLGWYGESGILRVSGERDAVQLVEQTTDLEHWSPFRILTNANGQVECSIPKDAPASGRFYRASTAVR